MKKIVLFLTGIALFGGIEIQQMKAQFSLPKGILEKKVDIAAGLKEALNNGISKQVSKLTAIDGFYKNEAVKILLPAELQKVDKTLRSMGMANLADDGLKVLNRAAEEGVKEATPIFIEAVKNMSFKDAKTILMGNENAATTYLQNETTTALYGKFSPVIQTSLSNVGADKIWATILTKYNAIPLVKKVNPDLKDYVTQETLKGVFKMVAIEEKAIRTNLKERNSEVLKKVFSLQDKK
jgi:hypothetical protein